MARCARINDTVDRLRGNLTLAAADAARGRSAAISSRPADYPTGLILASTTAQWLRRARLTYRPAIHAARGPPYMQQQSQFASPEMRHKQFDL